MWIEFIVIGGPTAQAETFYVGDDSSDGFFGGLTEINPVLLVIIFVLMAALVAVLIFGLQTPILHSNNYHQTRITQGRQTELIQIRTLMQRATTSLFAR